MSGFKQYNPRQMYLLSPSLKVKANALKHKAMSYGRVRVNHFITLLKLAPKVIKAIEELGDPMWKRYISERKLRSIVKAILKTIPLL